MEALQLLTEYYGRYSHALAQMGYEVEAVELVQHNIDVFRANTKPGEKITGPGLVLFSGGKL